MKNIPATMRLLSLAAALMLLFWQTPAGAQTVTDGSDGRRWGDMYELPAFSGRKGQEIIVRREGYTVSFNPKLRIPNWVAWILTEDRLENNVTSRPGTEAFIPDPDRRYNYQKYRYERGHICPAADNKWSERAMAECFYMSNICPMSVSLNHDEWNDIEEKCRNWAQSKYRTTIYVVGGIVPSEAGKGGRDIPAYVGENDDIAVPRRVFKAVLRNDPHDSLEALTGFDLFHNLPDRTEYQVEARDNRADWSGCSDF